MVELFTVEDLYEEFYFNIQHLRPTHSLTTNQTVQPINEHQTKFWMKLARPSGKLPTYASPNSTLTLTSDEEQNMGGGGGR